MEAVASVSFRGYQLAEEYQLGEPQAEYRSDNQLGWGLSAFMLGFGIFTLCGIVISLYPSPSSSSPSSMDWLALLTSFTSSLRFLTFALVGILFFIIGLVSLYSRLKERAQGELHAYICTKGIILARKQVVEVARWEDIKDIQRRSVYSEPKGKKNKPGEVDSPPVPLYTVFFKDGQEHIFRREPGYTIEHEFTAQRWSGEYEKIQAAQNVNFGWLSLDARGVQIDETHKISSGVAKAQNGRKLNPAIRLGLAQLDRKQVLRGTCIERGERFLPWSELELTWIDESKSTLIMGRRDQRKHWAIVPLYHITNAALCLRLMDQIMREKAQELA